MECVGSRARSPRSSRFCGGPIVPEREPTDHKVVERLDVLEKKFEILEKHFELLSTRQSEGMKRVQEPSAANKEETAVVALGNGHLHEEINKCLENNSKLTLLQEVVHGMERRLQSSPRGETASAQKAYNDQPQGQAQVQVQTQVIVDTFKSGLQARDEGSEERWRQLHEDMGQMKTQLKWLETSSAAREQSLTKELEGLEIRASAKIEESKAQLEESNAAFRGDMKIALADLSHEHEELRNGGFAAVDEEPCEPEVQDGDAEIKECVAEHGFGGSIWDASLFVMTTPYGTLGTLHTVLLLLINIVLQIIFTFLIAEEFTSTDYNDETTEALRAFRTRTAHDYKWVDPLTYLSLTARVCNEDPSLQIATSQLNVVGEVNAYLPEEEEAEAKLFKEYQGQLLCVLSLVVWCLTAAAEFKNIFLSKLCVLKVAYNNGFVPRSNLVNVDGTWELNGICRGRIVISSTLFLVRMFVASYLLYNGLKYICNTVDLRDLVLNAVALECVLSLDELIFSAGGSWVVTAVVENIAPLPLPKSLAIKGLDVIGVLVFVVLPTVITLTWNNFLQPQVKFMRDARSALCDGTIDFVFSRTNYPPYFVWSTSFPSNGDNKFTNKYLEATMNDIISDGPLAQSAGDSKLNAFMGAVWSVESTGAWNVQLATTKVNPACIDQLPSSASPSNPLNITSSAELEDYMKKLPDDNVRLMTRNRMRSAASFVQGVSIMMGTPMHDVRGCDDLGRYCDKDMFLGQIARSMCPHLCGCHKPNTQLVLSHPDSGCPLTCMDQKPYLEVLESIPCKDHTLEELKKSDLWAYYLATMDASAKNFPGFVQSMCMLAIDTLSKKGCAGILELIPKTQGYVNFCSEDPSRMFPFRSLTIVCPQTCKCTSTTLNCPKSCPSSTSR